MKRQTRVVITGMGTLNPLGHSVPEYWSNSLAGRSGIRPITEFAVPAGRSRIAGIVQDFPTPPGPGDRGLMLARAAAREAVRNAALPLARTPAEGSRRAVFLATAIAQIGSMERAFVQQSRGGTKPLEPLREPVRSSALLRTFHFNTVASSLAKEHGFQGACVTVPTGCTGGLDAIGMAMDAIRAGQADVALTGATEAPITPLVVAAFGTIGATSLRNDDPAGASRPFDVERDGFVLAEGAGVLVLESLEHAVGRGAPILAELVGYGSVNNCHHMTDIPEDGARIARSAELALADAGLTPGDIDMINAHGSSTPQNDVAEANAYWSLFGPRAETLPVTSNKSQIGHPLSASNSIEVISSVLSIREGTIPPTLNLHRKDSRCRLDVVAHEPRQHAVRRVLKTSSGFSGIHSSLVVQRYSGEASP
ncbi:beta-ketoacyl synthase [Myxococcus sp. RHSTA-1-4]|uniref:beta-ketoacyl-[acyl-carrier-protein] synthase family protein n=1 Tax=Myxococcus sp. RHSTA-1-4 TaxID=2874601 RepID=UPI001CBDBAC3|nr:beta-ketoacyl-[acyl-carrier-protein] synthase family protein [Myxococcus sp. RHSTA-1-4]MBZ4417199.1 beta-ketoacyl-[acyl-carrier-protein] synthase family protein [Myxococcus sp. RHSTA-1-4]